MTNHTANNPVEPGEFPFPIADGPGESPFLTWIRNHSNYMTARGLLDYFRFAAVLVRGILLNSLVLLPTLLMIALAFSFIYGGLLPSWTEGKPLPSWVQWSQLHLKSTPPFLLTPVVSILAAGWVLLFPIVMVLTKIAVQKQSLVTGRNSTIRWRDRYERSFGAALLLVIAVALFELLPLLVYEYHRLRQLLGAGTQGKELFATATAILVALSGAPKLLAMLGGVRQKLAIAAVAIVGLAVPLMVIVIVSDFLVYVPVPLGQIWLVVYLFLMTPGVYSAVILAAILVGLFRRAFSGREYVRLVGLLVTMVVAHLVLFAGIALLYVAVFSLLKGRPDLVPELLLAVKPPKPYELSTYGDLAVYVVLGAALEIWLFCWLTVDVNLTSIHGLYRDRLASAYLLDRDARGRVTVAEDIPLSTVCCHAAGSTAPYPLINVALNLQRSSDIGLRDRRSDFFVFSKKFIGSTRTGYCRSVTMEEVFPQIDLASAMAISAAAASPNMGRGTSPALVAFMTLLNVRLGVWIPNPGVLEERLSGRKARSTRSPGSDERGPGGFTFEQVFADELVSMRKRWEQLGTRSAERRLAESTAPTPAHGLAGIAFSGGGIRSATINLGIAQVLHRAGIFDHFDYMSTVSGGGYLGSSISTLMRRKTPPTPADTAAQAGGEAAAVRQTAASSFGSRFAWRVRPRLLVREMTMRLDEVHPWVNLSDGGHIENMAAIELLRRRCKVIVIGDGEQDGHHSFGGLATLIRTARLDLGVGIDLDLGPLRLDATRHTEAHAAIGRISYPGESECGYLLYLKSSCTGDEDEVIGEYRRRNEAFPHESTADQFFDEGQFEAYRALGQHIGEKAIEALLPAHPAGGEVGFTELVGGLQTAWELKNPS
jgi:hypothetical protein